jgi:hypothetical protein
MVVIVSMAACTGPSVGDGDAQSDSSGATTEVITSGMSTTTSSTTSVGSGESTAEPESSSSGSSESTAVDDDCPPALDDLASVSGIDVAKGWVWPEREGIALATCQVTAYDGEDLTLSCLQDEAPQDAVEVRVGGAGSPIAEAMASWVGMQGLRLGIPYGQGFFPGIFFDDFTLRSAVGELLLLRSAAQAGPGAQIPDVGGVGWALPFSELETVDHGCAFRPNDEQPFALELATDDGLVTVFHREQETVMVDGIAYEVSVDRAVVYDTSSCGGECVEADTSFSIVRHASE